MVLRRIEIDRHDGLGVAQQEFQRPGSARRDAKYSGARIETQGGQLRGPIFVRRRIVDVAEE
jgi:hypothetical protein